MGRMTLWDRIWLWLRHPLSTSASTIAFRYCENHGLEMSTTAECTCNCDNGYPCDVTWGGHMSGDLPVCQCGHTYGCHQGGAWCGEPDCTCQQYEGCR